MHSFLQDFRYGVRILSKTPGSTLAVLLLLAIGIGANTAVFSFVNALFFKPLHVANSDQLVGIYAKGHVSYNTGFSYPEYISLRDHSHAFSSLAADSVVAQLHLLIDGDAKEARGAFVTANYFSVLGVRPSLGRFFLPEEDQAPDRNPVVVLSDELWRSRFDANPDALGREFEVNGTSLKIAGIAPPGFHGFHPGNPEQLWMPTMMLRAAGYLFSPGTFNGTIFDELIGELSPGVSQAAVQDELRRIVVWSATDWPPSEGTRQIFALPATGVNPDQKVEFSAQMRLIMASAAALLLIACANLAGLFLARNVSRRQEIGIRLSIGAGKGRIVRQLMTESLLLSLTGCLMALPVSFLTRNFLAGYYSMDSEGFVHSYDLALDWRVLLFCISLGTATGLLFGLGPALRATRDDLITQIKGSGSSLAVKGRWRQMLVAMQVAMSLVLLVSAALLARSSLALRRGTNFDPEHVSLIRIRPEMLHYTPAQNDALFRRMVQQLQSLPEAESVTVIRGGEGLVWNWQNGREAEIRLPNSGISSPDAALKVLYHDIGLDFFRTLRIPLLQGRDFNAQDRPGSPAVAIINDTLARQLWRGSRPVGQIIMVNKQPVQVVGVSASIQPPNATEPPAPYLYLPFWQLNPGREGDLRIAIRVHGDPVAQLSAIRKAIQSVDPAAPMGEDMSMQEQMQMEYMPVMLSRTIVACCGLLALCLSALGLYSVLTLAVRSRMRDIGVRMALGAQASDVLKLVLREGVSIGLAGAVIGLLAALAASRLLSSWIYGVRTMDLLSFAGGAALLLATSIFASYLPARRAAQVDPLVALRQE